MGYKTSIRGHDTLASLQAHEAAMAERLREDQKVVAARVVRSAAKKDDWPQDDVDEVLNALGLMQ